MRLKDFSRKLKLKIKAIYLAYKHKDTSIVAKISEGIQGLNNFFMVTIWK